MNIDSQSEIVNNRTLSILIVDKLPGSTTTLGCYLVQPQIEPDLIWEATDTSDVLVLSKQFAPDVILLNLKNTEIDCESFIAQLQLLAGTYLLPTIAVLRDVDRSSQQSSEISLSDRAELLQNLQAQIAAQSQVEQQLREQMESQTDLIEELAQANDLFRQRNQELDAFATIISHDLRAPLRGIANLATWLSEDLEDVLTPDTRQQLGLIENRARRMDLLITDLLAYARSGQQRTEKVVVDVNELLTDMIDFLAISNEFTIEIGSKMPTLITEKLALQQVFSNLIVNAVNHHDRPNGRVKIVAQLQSDSYLFEVIDDGPGIRSNDRERIFEVFQTLQPTSENSDSTGIGLAIAKRIVELRSGQIWVDSTVGAGSKFSFTWAV